MDSSNGAWGQAEVTSVVPLYSPTCSHYYKSASQPQMLKNNLDFVRMRMCHEEQAVNKKLQWLQVDKDHFRSPRVLKMTSRHDLFSALIRTSASETLFSWKRGPCSSAGGREPHLRVSAQSQSCRVCALVCNEPHRPAAGT